MNVTNLSELQYYVNLLEDYHERKYTNYELLRRDLLIEFGVKVSREEIQQMYEPTIDEEVEDMSILYRNVIQ